MIIGVIGSTHKEVVKYFLKHINKNIATYIVGLIVSLKSLKGRRSLNLRMLNKR